MSSMKVSCESLMLWMLSEITVIEYINASRIISLKWTLNKSANKSTIIDNIVDARFYRDDMCIVLRRDRALLC